MTKYGAPGLAGQCASVRAYRSSQYRDSGRWRLAYEHTAVFYGPIQPVDCVGVTTLVVFCG